MKDNARRYRFIGRTGRAIPNPQKLKESKI